MIGGLCTPQFSLLCENPQVYGTYTNVGSSIDPCATVALFPVLTPLDFQPVDPVTGLPRWKERIVHTFTEVDVQIIMSNGWIQDVYKKWLADIAGYPAGAPSDALMIIPYRTALVIYDDQDVINSAASLFDAQWLEQEKYLPGTLKQETWWQPGLVGTQMNRVHRMRTVSRARRRLHTGEGLYWQFELGCPFAVGAEGTAFDLYAAYGTPLSAMGFMRTAYIE